MKKYSFTKMSGAGNDFVVFDLKETPEIECSPVFIQTVCDRRNGIGADGVLVIGNKPGFIIVWNILILTVPQALYAVMAQGVLLCLLKKPEGLWLEKPPSGLTTILIWAKRWILKMLNFF